MDETIKARLDAISESQRRTRLAFFVSVILSLCLFVVSWNAYGSWYRSFALREAWSGNEVTRFSQEKLVEAWIKSRMVKVPLLGIDAGVSDAPFLGSLSMLIIATWFWFSAKQENQAIGRLLCETKGFSNEKRDSILHGITSSMVFTSVAQYAGPINSLRLPLQPSMTVSVSWVFRGLIFLPAISTTLVILGDLLSLLLDSPFRYPRERLFHAFRPEDWGRMAIETGFALILVVIIYVICWQIFRFVESTASVVQEFSQIP